MGLADELIERLDNPLVGYERKPFSVGDTPEHIVDRHPAVYKIQGMLYCDHRIISPGDKRRVFELLDSPDAEFTKAQVMWVYNRLYESAPDLDDRYIVASRDMVWDKETATLMPIGEMDNFITMSDKGTKRIRREYGRDR